MTWLYAIAILLGSCLLFLVQPMCAKMLLPLLGGTPAVWNTCMVFFQSGLLAGYAYAHALPHRLGVGRHAVVHLIALVLAYWTLPIRLPEEIAEGWHPIAWLLMSMTLSVALPFVLLAAGAPLLQRWYLTKAPGQDPYFLYAASNLGSFVALVVFPLVLEPFLSLREQGEVWRFGFLFVTALVAFCIPLQRAAIPGTAPISVPVEPNPTWTQRGRWMLLALAPSSLLLSVTAHLTTDIAAIPLLWLLPMGLYLLTFTIVFARKQMVSLLFLRRWLPLVAIVVLLVKLSEATEPLAVVLSIHLIAFFWLALVCHGELAQTRPGAAHLTDFYLCIAVGGVLGGVLNALVAPLIFSTFAEYPLMVVLACALGIEHGTRPSRADWAWASVLGAGTAIVILAIQASPQFRTDLGTIAVAFTLGVPLVLCYLMQKHPARFALGLAGVLAASSLAHGPTGAPLYVTRTYFGVHRVTQKGSMRCLVHGNTVHGQQNFDPDEPDQRDEPLTYYSRSGPIGDVLRSYQGDARLKNVGVIGLGTGSLAAYSEPGQTWTFFEIDPAVLRIAQNPRFFTFLADARGTLRHEIGDARLTLKKSPQTFGVLIVDAFGSDSIPLHLLTREAMSLYFDHLEPTGILAFHISNNYVDLETPLANLSADRKPPGVAKIRRHRVLTQDEKRRGVMPSDWMVVARESSDLKPLRQTATWTDAASNPRQRVWTDDYSNLLEVFRWQRGE